MFTVMIAVAAGCGIMLVTSRDLGPVWGVVCGIGIIVALNDTCFYQLVNEVLHCAESIEESLLAHADFAAFFTLIVDVVEKGHLDNAFNHFDSSHTVNENSVVFVHF